MAAQDEIRQSDNSTDANELQPEAASGNTHDVSLVVVPEYRQVCLLQCIFLTD
jgi:hypothetical protein